MSAFVLGDCWRIERNCLAALTMLNILGLSVMAKDIIVLSFVSFLFVFLSVITGMFWALEMAGLMMFIGGFFPCKETF